MSTIEASAPAAASVGGGALDQLCVNTIRTLAMDAVQQANSDHPTPSALTSPVASRSWNPRSG